MASIREKTAKSCSCCSPGFQGSGPEFHSWLRHCVSSTESEDFSPEDKKQRSSEKKPFCPQVYSPSDATMASGPFPLLSHVPFPDSRQASEYNNTCMSIISHAGVEPIRFTNRSCVYHTYISCCFLTAYFLKLPTPKSVMNLENSIM